MSGRVTRGWDCADAEGQTGEESRVRVTSPSLASRVMYEVRRGGDVETGAIYREAVSEPRSSVAIAHLSRDIDPAQILVR